VLLLLWVSMFMGSSSGLWVSTFALLTGMEASWLSLWPRRANQALLHSMKTGMPCHTFPLPQTNDLGELQEYASAIAAHEAQTTR
jgi:hypothetical protein